MRHLYRNLLVGGLLYVAAVAVNVSDHYGRYCYSKAASQDTVHHGPNLRATWANVAEMYRQDMLSPKVLIPLEFLVTPRPEEPIMIREIR